jgi:hypothetical protein
MKAVSSMSDLNTTTQIVRNILEVNNHARNSDSYLYLKVLEHVSEKNGIGLEDLTVPEFLTSIDFLGFPGFETVRRSRQKIQATYPELASSEKVAAMRMENEKVFRAFARGEV